MMGRCATKRLTRELALHTMAWLFAALLLISGLAAQELAQPGGAGYAIVLNNHAIITDSFNNFPSEEFTFEAWISTYSGCRTGTLMSYALDPPDDADAETQLRDLNHFVVYHFERIIGCHDYETGFSIFEQLLGLTGSGTCRADFVDRNEETTPPVFTPNGTWHHVAVTWTAANDGETFVYKDGVLVGSAVTEKRRPLQPGGIFMLGGKQECFGSCADELLAYYGLMDEVRIWNVSRTPRQIRRFMTRTGRAVEKQDGLVAYWKFDDPLDPTFEEERMAIDSSGNGNHLPLFNPPVLREVTVQQGEVELDTGALVFENSYALNNRVNAMPVEDFTVDFWARLLIRPFDPDHPQDVANQSRLINLMSYVTTDAGVAEDGFRANVISIYVDHSDFTFRTTDTSRELSIGGAVGVFLTGLRPLQIWFDTEWLDDDWHHVAVTYDAETSTVQLFFDGDEKVPFWKTEGLGVRAVGPENGGVGGELSVEPRSQRGSLALGRFQGCYGGCFSAFTKLHGMIANFRIWDQALSPFQIANSMRQSLAEVNAQSLTLAYEFSEDTILGEGRIGRFVIDHSGDANLYLGAVMPHYEFSYAPLTTRRGRPLAPPSPGVTGYALELSARQIVSVSDFEDFPTDAVTVEFWMWSVDTCYSGVPFSYTTGDDPPIDALTLLNYRDWILVVNGDFGISRLDQPSFGSTDGTWHHIAFTWEQSTGSAALYDNGRVHWIGERLVEALTPGGTLVLGREQDCLGGCFDSLSTAFNGTARQSGEAIQDFLGLIDNVRIWSVVRSAEEIFASMRFDLDQEDGVPNSFLSASDPDLVAWWTFDEGRGTTVEDVTGKGHDLEIRGTPLWVVSNRLGSCGDGLLSQTEECDDGNRVDGDGCSSDCRAEIELDEITEVAPGLEPEVEAISLESLPSAGQSQSVELAFVDPTFDRTPFTIDDDDML